MNVTHQSCLGLKLKSTGKFVKNEEKTVLQSGWTGLNIQSFIILNPYSYYSTCSLYCMFFFAQNRLDFSYSMPIFFPLSVQKPSPSLCCQATFVVSKCVGGNKFCNRSYLLSNTNHFRGEESIFRGCSPPSSHSKISPTLDFHSGLLMRPEWKV